MTEGLITGLFVLMLSTFLGLDIIRRVSRLLHTPLMSLTNAISAIANIVAAGMAKTSDGRIVQPGPIKARIYAGRRAFMDTDDMLARVELTQYDVQLRTYDQLVEILGAICP